MPNLTATEAAKLIGVSRQTIHRWRKSRELSYTEKTEQGFLYDPSEVLRVAQNKNVTLPDITGNSKESYTMLQDATPKEADTPKDTSGVTQAAKNVTGNSKESNTVLQDATPKVTDVLQQKINELSQEKAEITLKEALAQKEIELLREQIEEIKKDKDRIFSLVEKNTLLLEYVQEENKNLKQQMTEVTTKKKKWWFF